MVQVLLFNCHSPAVKPCFRCGSWLPIDEFYSHPQMADGHLNKCKTCTKSDVRKHYANTIEARHTYDRERRKCPERRKAAGASLKRQKLAHPEKAAARNAVSNAIRDGRLLRQPCSRCGAAERVEAHHHDYSKPLDVEWMCFPCHRTHGHGQRVSVA